MLDVFPVVRCLGSNVYLYYTNRYSCAQPLWSCAWNTDDRNYFYAGQANGVVNVFDVRNTNDAVEQLSIEGSRSPVASLEYIPQNMSHQFR